MSPLRAAIVDDEPLARARLRRLLQAVGHEMIDVVTECVDVNELLSEASRIKIDLLFLDIEMPGADGFVALDRWQGPRPQVVLVTAHSGHGVRAFDHRATDYLLKPLSAERLKDTLTRLSFPDPCSGSSMAIASESPSIALPIGNRTHRVPMNQIDLVLAQANYLEIHAAGSRYLVRSTLSDFHLRLSQKHFLRVHRGAVVRAEAVREVMSLGSGRFQITLSGGQQLSSGRHYRMAMIGLAKGMR